MDITRATRRLAVGVATVGLIAGCATGTSAPPTAAPPTAPPSLPSAVAPTASPMAIVEHIDVAYETPDPLLQPGLLDVYAPTTDGPWPVAVMFHGSPPRNAKSTWQSRARELAAHGFVVFVPSWGHGAGTVLASPGYDELRAAIAETACAVAFAQSRARSYGGDPSTTVVFGHSAGANIASVIAFARPAPTAGCIGATSLGPIHALISWDGDWLMIDPTWDTGLAADPRLLDLYTPLRPLRGTRISGS